MLAIILAGGYAKRLWPLTLDKPKALLPIAGKPMIDYVIEKLIQLRPPISEIIITTNLKFQSQFQEWLRNKGYRSIELVPDSSQKEEEKLGAIRALSNIVTRMDEEDIFVLPSDNLFADDLNDFLRFFYEKHAPTIALYYARGFEEATRGATVTIDKSGSILEKPKNPNTTLMGASIYAFPERIGERLKEYLELHLPNDEPGRFIEWLYKQELVYGYKLKNYV